MFVKSNQLRSEGCRSCLRETLNITAAGSRFSPCVTVGCISLAITPRCPFAGYGRTWRECGEPVGAWGAPGTCPGASRRKRRLPNELGPRKPEAQESPSGS